MTLIYQFLAFYIPQKSYSLFVFLIVLHGKKYGKKTPLYQYNPYNPNSKLPFKVKLVLLIIAVIVLTTTLLSRILVIK